MAKIWMMIRRELQDEARRQRDKAAAKRKKEDEGKEEKEKAEKAARVAARAFDATPMTLMDPSDAKPAQCVGIHLGQFCVCDATEQGLCRIALRCGKFATSLRCIYSIDCPCPIASNLRS